MKKLVLILALFVGIITVAEAQRNTSSRPSQTNTEGRQRMDPNERIDQQVAQMQKKLALTEEQTTKVKALLKANMEKNREAFQNARESGQEVDREKMRAQMKAQTEKQDNEIKALLTADQKVKYDAMLKERQEKMKSRQGASDRKE
ncbi:hypothetical protein [Mangrovibacterium sp.]|uniref:hypothetical protein n=1 Tax=Mangrovibacterium sp. TaxID=1961364 RepID=UPI0035673308